MLIVVLVLLVPLVFVLGFRLGATMAKLDDRIAAVLDPPPMAERSPLSSKGIADQAL